MSIGIGCSILHAREMIYADGIDLDSDRRVTPIGVSCRICPRLECGQRAHPPADHSFRIDENERLENLYARMQ
jgi:predicted transcriptional regulator